MSCEGTSHCMNTEILSIDSVHRIADAIKAIQSGFYEGHLLAQT